MIQTPIWRFSSPLGMEASSPRCRRSSPPQSITFSSSEDDDDLPDKKDSPPQFMRRILLPKNVPVR
eukprot:scaffold421146_cov61-Attheya_sp.AAC.2